MKKMMNAIQELTMSSQASLAEDAAPEEAGWDLIVLPHRGLLDLRLGEIWQYRDLLYMFVKRDFVTFYKQTVLGPIWFFVQPILTMLVYVLVFGRIANISTDGIPRPLFYLAGIVLWNFFADSFEKTSSVFLTNAQIFGKVYFPRLVVPLAMVLSGAMRFSIQFLLFAVCYAWYMTRGESIHPNAFLWAAPVSIVMMASLGFAFGLVVSALTTKYRDLRFLLKFGVQLLMYGTPIIYPMSILSEKVRLFLWWNPLSHWMELFKYGFLGAGSVSVAGLAYATAFTLLAVFVGLVLFSRTERSFMDTV